MSTGETWRLGHRPALDGLRGVAVLLVLASHLHFPGAGISGAVGVVTFFALSGFLITTLLLERRESLGRFYLRRAARLVPALVMCVALYVTLQLVILGRVTDERLIVGGLTYTTNWLQAASNDQGSGLAHLWSLAVEEQFYLVWPLLLLGLARFPRRVVVPLLAGTCGAILLLRLAFWVMPGAGYLRVYYGFDTRADELLIGCALAMWMSGRREGRAAPWVGVVALGGVVALSWSSDPFGALYMPTVAAALTAVVLYVAVNGNQAAWLTRPWLTWFGRRSYGIYLYHLPLRWAFEQIGAPGWVTTPAVLAMTLGLAELSWRYVEQPFLRRRSVRVVADPVRAPLIGEVHAAG